MGNEPRVYAESILKTCQLSVESPLVCMAGVTGSDLKKRIEQLEKGGAKKDLPGGTATAVKEGTEWVGAFKRVGTPPGAKKPDVFSTDARIVITDLSGVLLDLAQRSFRVREAEYLTLDVRDPFPFPNDSFDLIVANMVFNEIPNAALRCALGE